jgi:hypothetical protein
MLGADSLQELRITCTLAEQEMEGGVASRISPLARVCFSCMLLSPNASTQVVGAGVGADVGVGVSSPDAHALSTDRNVQ